MKQINIRIPDDLHADLRDEAKAHLRSINSEILSALYDATEARRADRVREEADARAYGHDADEYLEGARTPKPSAAQLIALRRYLEAWKLPL